MSRADGGRRRPGAAALLALALAGCGEAEARPETHRVEIRAFQFVPASDTVAVGDTVVWVNADLVPHTATASNGAWDSGSIATEGSGRVVATAAGEYPYVCAFHPTMKGTLVVR